MTSSPVELERSEAGTKDKDERRIGVGELRAGDVLLYHRSSMLGRVMRLFDGSDVSHAALYLGDGVAEATGEGVLGRSLRVSLGGDPDDYIVVHRMADGAAPHSLAGVVARARGYVAQHLQYGHSTIALIAFLVLSRKIPLTAKMRVLLRLVLDRAAADLLALAKSDSQRLICSELVFRCYTEVPAPEGPYELQIQGATSLESNAAGDLGSLLDQARGILGKEQESTKTPADDKKPAPQVSDDELDRAAEEVLVERERALESNEVPLGQAPELLESLQRFASAVRNTTDAGKDLESASPFDRFEGVVASFVSPGDLRRSRSIPFQGRLVMDEVEVASAPPPDEAAAPRTVTKEVQGMSAEMASADWDLDQAIAGNRRVVASRAARRLAGLVRDGEPLPEEQAVSILAKLRKKRFFAEMLELGEVLLRQRADLPLRVARQYAQALIETRNLTAALAFLDSLLPRTANDADEDAEVRGLIGRANKQLYVESRVANDAQRDQQARTLQAAIDAYYGVYKRDPAKHTWHGINLVALLVRGGLKLPEDPVVLATAIRDALAAPKGAWQWATRAEAHIALGELGPALVALNEYVRQPETDAFECASTLRQLEEVWRIREDGPQGAAVAILRAALLRKQGGETELEVGGLQSALAGAAQQQQDKVFEKAFSTGRPRELDFYQNGLRTARAVARIEDDAGTGMGTGFLMRGQDVFPQRPDLAGELILVTNAHVLGHTDAGALRPAGAAVRFEAVGDLARTLRVKELLFESSPNELDATIVRLDAAIPGVDPIPPAPRAEPAFDAKKPRPLYVIGYPRGGHLAISMEDCFQVGWEPPRFLHYRTPTEPGSSGSPVFDDKWQVVALHHAAIKDANEGIWIHRVLDAAAAVAAPKVESAPAVSKAALRAGVFVSYSHADKQWLDRLQQVLAPIVGGEGLDVWADTRLQAGDQWAREIEKAMDAARVAVLLVSPAFLASRFILEQEFPRILDASRKSGVRVIWVPVTASLYEFTPLKDLQAARDPARPLDALTDAERAAALVEIARAIHAASDVSRLKNAFSVADQMALQAGGMGGKMATPADLGAQAHQEGDGLAVMARGGQMVTTIQATELDTLPDDARQLIAAYEKGMRLAYQRYLAAYPDQFADDAQISEKAAQTVAAARRGVCTNLNLILDFLQSMNKQLADHYTHVRKICSG